LSCKRSIEISFSIEAPAFSVGIITEILMRFYCITVPPVASRSNRKNILNTICIKGKISKPHEDGERKTICGNFYGWCLQR
jgi:hypothetical protein